MTGNVGSLRKILLRGTVPGPPTRWAANALRERERTAGQKEEKGKTKRVLVRRLMSERNSELIVAGGPRLSEACIQGSEYHGLYLGEKGGCSSSSKTIAGCRLLTKKLSNQHLIEGGPSTDKRGLECPVRCKTVSQC